MGSKQDDSPEQDDTPVIAFYTEDLTFSLCDLPELRLPVVDELLPLFQLCQQYGNPFTELQFLTEAFKNIFTFNYIRGFSSVEEYREFSKRVCEDVREIASHMDAVSRDTGIAKVVGGTTAVAGGVLTIVGIALIPVTLGVSSILSGVGLGVGLAGGLTSAGSTIAEVILNKQDNESFEDRFKDFKEAALLLITFAQCIHKQSELTKSYIESSEGKQVIRSIISTGLASISTVKTVASTTYSFVKLGQFWSIAGFTDEAISLGKGALAPGIFGLEAGGLAARSISGTFAAIGVIFGALDVALGTWSIVQRSSKAKELREMIGSIERANEEAIEMHVQSVKLALKRSDSENSDFFEFFDCIS